MSNYQLCCQYRGKVVHIYEKSGRVHHGKIVEVDQEFVWIDPVKKPGGFAYGYPGYGYGYGAGYGAGFGGYGYPAYGYGRNPFFVPVALAAVGGLALGAAFFW